MVFLWPVPQVMQSLASLGFSCFRLVAPDQPKLQTNLLLTKVMFKTSDIGAQMLWLNQILLCKLFYVSMST